MPITFRTATPDDIDVITHFNLRLAAETEDKSLPADTVRRGVERGLKLAPEIQYFVAEVESQVVGQVMLTREWSDWRNGWAVWIQSVYVHKDHRGQGIFGRLFEHVRQIVEQQPDIIMIRLYVEQDNETAIRTYEKLGFENPGYRVMELTL